MPEFFDYDPVSGITYYFDDVPDTDNAVLTAEQDVEPLLDYCAEMRATGATDAGIKGGMWHYAMIPPVVQIQLRQMGLDINSRDETVMRRIRSVIQDKYPKLMTTNKKIHIAKTMPQ